MALTALICALLGFAAWRDIATRTIPDGVSIALLIIGLAIRVPGGWTAVATSAATMMLVFVVLLPLHSRGLIGGADLKLLAALAFGLSPFGSYQMVACVVLAGGVLALVYVALRRVLIHFDTMPHAAPRHGPIVHRIFAVELWRIRRGAPLPYALAIALGAAFVIGHQGV